MDSSAMRRLGATVVALCLLFLLVSTASAALKPDRPSNVPDDFIVTPNGYFHPSCVQHLEAGEVIDVEKKWITRQGFPTKRLGCNFSHFDAEGREFSPRATIGLSAPPNTVCPVPNVPCGGNQVNYSPSWVIFDSIELASPIAEFWQTTIVPSAPTHQVGQIIYLFPGLQEGTETGANILQPVIAWNGVWGTSGYANQWEMVSWNCCFNGQEIFSTPVLVSPGDLIIGEMQGINCNAAGVCPNWDVSNYDQSTVRSTQLPSTSGYNQSYYGMFGAVLEVYGVSTCDEMPASNAVWDYNPNNYQYGPPFAMRYATINGWIYTPPSWSTTVNKRTSAPACGYSSTPHTGGGFYLTY